jgi:hypothetical protein
MTTRERMEALERLAADPSAAPGERRNAANAAARLRAQLEPAHGRAPTPAELKLLNGAWLRKVHGG